MDQTRMNAPQRKEQTRLDKYLTEAGLGSRSDVKKMIRSGRVLVNGSAAKSADLKIDPDTDEVLTDGQRVRPAVIPTLMLNKPAGVVSATKDAHFQTVTDLIREPWAGKLFPVGRLDKDTEGLLLLTTDGALSHGLLSPKKHVSKTYFAVISGAPDQSLVRHFREGSISGRRGIPFPQDFASLRLPKNMPYQNMPYQNMPHQNMLYQNILCQNMIHQNMLYQHMLHRSGRRIMQDAVRTNAAQSFPSRRVSSIRSSACSAHSAGRCVS